MALNRKKLRKVRAWLLGDVIVPKLEGVEFNMDHYFEEVDHNGEPVWPNDDDYDNKCGTVCCIAGAVVAMSMRQRTLKGLTQAMEGVGICSTAMDDLGLSNEQAEALFTPWDVDDGSWGVRISGTNVTPEWAAAVIDHLLETGEVNWGVGAPESVRKAA